MTQLTASLVLYHTPAAQVEAVVASFFGSAPHGRLLVVDNSATPSALKAWDDPRIEYRFAGRNLGFGAGHNLAIRSLVGSDLHLILNPDVHFGPDVLPGLMSLMQAEPGIGAVMPRIVYPDGRLQPLYRLLPTPADLFVRRFLPQGALRDRLRARYELDGLPQDRLSEVPILSGCFLLVRTALLQDIGGFDERYFMYMEDYDLVRRLGARSRTVYAPQVSVVHEYAQGSYKSRILLRHHLRSAWRYFMKWGWCFDAERRRRNAQALQQLGLPGLS